MKSQRLAKQAYIVKTTRRLFETCALEDCSMEQIATAAEYTRRTLYSYFKCRDDLYLRIHVEDMTRRWEFQLSALAQATGGLARIRAYAESLVAYSRANPQSGRLDVYWDFCGIDPKKIDPTLFEEFESLNGQLAEDLRDMFRSGVADGSLRDDLDVDMAMSQFVYSLRAVLNRSLSTTYGFIQFDADQFMDHFINLFEHGVKSPGGQQ